MDIISILKQARTSDISGQIADVLGECVKYEQLSRAERFQQFADNDFLAKQCPILSELHTTPEWSVDQWKLGMVVYETLIALGITDFFHGQTAIQGRLQSRRRDDMNMKTIVQFQVRDVEEFKGDGLLASVTHGSRIVVMTEDTMYVGATPDTSDKEKTVKITDVAPYVIKIMPDEWSYGLKLGIMNDQLITMGRDAILVGSAETIPREQWGRVSNNVDTFIQELLTYQAR